MIRDAPPGGEPRGGQRIPGPTKADRDAAVEIARLPNAEQLEPPATQWRYLQSEAFSARNVLAAHFLRDCPTVVEIGGWHTPIDGYLTGRHRSIIVIDPYMRDSVQDRLNGESCCVRHVGARFQDLRWTVRPGHHYGLAMLGLDMTGLTAADEQRLFALVRGARTTVIEFPTSWRPALRQYARLLSETGLEERVRIGLDLAGNDFGDLSNSWPPHVERELYVLRPRS